jgi:soluble lytic murein transglycosylase
MLRLRFSLILGLGLVFLSSALFAYSFDNSINSLSEQYKNKEYQTILTRLTALEASKELEDIYLYLRAEALKGLKRNSEAAAAYEKLYAKHPKSETAKQALFNSFLLKLEEANEHSLIALEALASKLSPWQSGNAFEKLHNLNFVKAGKKSRYALHTLRSYSQGMIFYRQFPSTQGMLKQIWANTDVYEFVEKEWLEILKLSAHEGLLDIIFNKNPKGLALITNRLDSNSLAFYRAQWLSSQKKYSEAIKGYESLINNPKASGLLRLQSLLGRANCHQLSNKHALAISDYKEVLKGNEAGFDKLEAEYRLVKSYFALKNDAEAIKGIRGLIQGKRMGWMVPTNLYDMGLECYDAREFGRAQSYFALFLEYYIGHHRAQAALGYGAKAAGAADGLGFRRRLFERYGNSFFIWWLEPKSAERRVAQHEGKLGALNKDVAGQLGRLSRLWDTEFGAFVRAEANLLTERHARDFAVFKALIELALSKDDYQAACGYGERLARQLLDAGRSVDEMPIWAWKAMYPLAHEAEVRANGKRFGVDPFWILAIMREESHFQVDIKSRSNAMSLMQILPTTGRWIAEKLGEKGFKEANLWDVKTNIRYGTWYLRYLWDLFNGDMILASAAYNGGQGNITRKVQAVYGHLPVLERIDKVPMTETRDYYKKVMSTYLMYKRIYGK